MNNYKKNYFSFKKLDDSFLLTNDLGRYIFLNARDFNNFINDKYDYHSDLHTRLVKEFFVIDCHKELFIENVSSEIREVKNYLFEGTQLHIFVVTKNCNQSCLYCQASADSSENLVKNNMTPEQADRSVDIAFESPSRNLNFEFQGGEPLLNFNLIKHIIKYTNEKNIDNIKNITFSIVSNLIMMNTDIIDYLIINNVSISTSLDGYETLHVQNRPCKIKDYYNTICTNINKINQIYKANGSSDNRVQAIQTTTKFSLKYPEDIIDSYLKVGLNNLFIRPLTPLGYASGNWNVIGYSAEEFVEFYLTAIDYMISLSIKGKNISDSYFTILLRKIIKRIPQNYMELRSPCGAAIGQLTYNYNGSIYTCDEGRMLAELGDESFKLGDVFNNNFLSLVENPITKALCVSSCLETIPGCEECVYSPYCGTCPIINYVLEGSIFAKIPTNYKCIINKAIFNYIFMKLKENDEREIKVFLTWVN